MDVISLQIAEKYDKVNMSTVRCLYCGMYGKKMLANKCLECLKELRDITDMLNNKPKNQIKYENNVIPLRTANK